MSDDKPPSTSTGWLDRLVNLLSPAPDNRDQLSAILQKSHESQIINSDALEIMEGALRVDEIQAREIMIPRSQMEIINVDDDPDKILAMIIESGHSRFPVVGESSEDVLGILLAKDLLSLVLTGIQQMDLLGVLRPATIIPESKRLGVLLREFREKRYHMAIVVDEYGSVSGLLTIEDILEEIVGDIEDETDEEETSSLKKVGPDTWMIEAQMEVEQFNEEFGAGLSEDDFDTIGGVLAHAFGHLPAAGESVYIENMHFEIVDADNRRIQRVKLTISEDRTAE
jgi:magnesium and cobalt transporter